MNVWNSGCLLIVACAVVACGSGDTETATSSTSATSSVSSTAAAGGAGQGGMSSSSAAGGSGGTATGGTGGTGGAGGAGGQTGSSCTWSINNPCPSGQYCDAPACAQGTCKPLGSPSMAPKSAVCGCDGLNYWNADLAAAQGMAVDANGVCSTQIFCGGIAAKKCPDPNTQSCVYDVINSTGCFTSDVPGWCWVLPTTCPSSAAKQHRRCNQRSCDTECEAMKSGQKYYGDGNCK